jgi:tetratricopeptide (TPR) repeat protein
MKIGSRIHFIQAMKDIRKQDYEAASKAFARGLEGEPDNVLARISYARTLYLADDKTGARQALEKALALQPNNSLCLFLLGILAEEAGDAAVAAAYYQRAIRSIPDHAGAHHFLANQYYRQGDYASAAQHYASSLKGEPDNLGAVIPYHGTLLLGDAPAATLMTELESAIERFPEYPGTRALQILLLAGSPDPAIHDPETALEKAQQLNGQYPIPPHRELLALAWAATGNYQKAVSMLEELLPYVRRAMPAEAAPGITGAGLGSNR